MKLKERNPQYLQVVNVTQASGSAANTYSTSVTPNPEYDYITGLQINVITDGGDAAFQIGLKTASGTVFIEPNLYSNMESSTSVDPNKRFMEILAAIKNRNFFITLVTSTTLDSNISLQVVLRLEKQGEEAAA